MIPIGFVPHDPDHSAVFWSGKPHPSLEALRRWAIVAAVRRGRSQHQVAEKFHVSQSTVHHWVHLAQGQRLDRVNWHDRPHDPKAPHRTEAVIEDLVLAVRCELEKTSDV